MRPRRLAASVLLGLILAALAPLPIVVNHPPAQGRSLTVIEGEPLGPPIDRLAAAERVALELSGVDDHRLWSQATANGVRPPLAPNDGSTYWSIQARAVGWPARACVISSVTDVYFPGFDLNYAFNNLTHRVEHRDCFQILWGGLLLDAATAVLALTAAVELVALAHHIRRRRLTPGLCPNCTYPLLGLRYPLCPECGHAEFKESVPDFPAQ